MVHGEAASKQGRICYFCETKENERRAIGDFIVKLTSVDHDDTQVLACQTCRRKAVAVKKEPKKTFARKLNFFGFGKSKKA